LDDPTFNKITKQSGGGIGKVQEMSFKRQVRIAYSLTKPIPFLTANQLKQIMNIRHIRQVILVNLQDIKRSIEFFLALTLVLTGATIGTAIACIVGYKIALLFCGLFGITI
jgi:hypothetical protein